MSKHIVRFYDAFAPVYPVLNLFLATPKRELLSRVNSEPPGRLLEIGVGRGENLQAYKHAPVTGIDMSRGMLAFARKKAPEGCRLEVMDAQALDFPENSFDYVVISHVLSVVDNPGRVMSEVYRVTVPGGKVFILNHECPENGGKGVDLLRRPVAKLLRFKTAFEVEPAVDPARFDLEAKGKYGLLPRISLYVLRKKEETAH